ncbi:MAG: ACP S-malonyltransferase [Cellvibrionales bacterium]|nr:ACP S-malonyltransferase [Cellvibrionales bacterium]
MSDKAFVFPGQGSQKVGMLKDVADQFPEILTTFEEASTVVGYDMWKLIQEGEQDALNMTEVTQPVLLTSSVAYWRLWQSQGLATPVVLAGHSLGEFSALVCAESLAFADAVNLVKLRGQFMQTAVPVGVGAMAAIIGLDDDVIDKICAETSTESGVVQAVNYNSPGQVVIAGHAAAVDLAIEKLKEAGAKRAMPLPVSAPFHTDLMQPAGVNLKEAMSDLIFHTPKIPVVHNVHAKTESDPNEIKALMVKQIYSPVKWTDCVRTISQMGVKEMIECGPGKVLSGLAKRIDKSLSCQSIDAALLK